MPVGVVGIVNGVHTLGVYGILDVQQNSISGAGTGRQPQGRVNRYVMALVSIGRLYRAFLAMRAAVVQAVDRARPGIDKYPRARHDGSFLRSSQRNLDHINAKQGRIRVFVRFLARASRQFFHLAHKRSARHIDINTFRIVRIDHQRVGM